MKKTILILIMSATLIAAARPCSTLFFLSNNVSASASIQELVLSMRQVISESAGPSLMFEHIASGSPVLIVPEKWRFVEGETTGFRSNIDLIRQQIADSGEQIVSKVIEKKANYSELNHLACKAACAISFTGLTGSSAAIVLGLIGMMPSMHGPAPGAMETFLGGIGTGLIFSVSKDYLSKNVGTLETRRDSPMDSNAVLQDIKETLDSNLFVKVSESKRTKTVVVMTVPDWMRTTNIVNVFGPDFKRLYNKQELISVLQDNKG